MEAMKPSLLVSVLWTVALGCTSAPAHVAWDDAGVCEEEPVYELPSCDEPAPDLQAIRDRGVLRVALPASGDAALIDAGRIRGFELDLIRSFAMRQGVQVELTLIDVLEERLEGLQDARFDLIAVRDPRRATAAVAVPLDERAHLAAHPDATTLQQALRKFATSQQDRIGRLASWYDSFRARAHVSSYDDDFKAAATATPWRWTLLAAVAWQESRFNPRARSAAGALGLMQLIRPTALRYGVTDRTRPDQAIRGGAAFLTSLDRRFRDQIPDGEQRLPFVLASYNAGPGHVDDARLLTRQFGGDDTDWRQVEPWMLSLAQREYNQLPGVRYGYCRGSEPVDYVRKVLHRRGLYDALLPPDREL